MSIRYAIHPDYASFEKELHNVKSHFERSGESIHKARNELRIAKINGLNVVIKAFRVPHLLNRLVYAYFRDSKAKKSYANAVELLKRGVDTPQPIGYIEFLEAGLFAQSYFLALYEPYDFTIREAFHHKIDDYRDVIDAFAAFTYDLHRKGVWHVDYSPGNILIRRTQQGYCFMLVDINRMQFKEISPETGLSNFSKFWAQREDLERMATIYAGLAGMDKTRALTIAEEAAAALRAKTELKRKLKGQK